MRIIAALSKYGRASYISHLDVQRTIQRAMRRADLPLRFSNGFNPHPEVHFATALSTGDESCCEWFDVLLDGTVAPEEFTERLNPMLPGGLSVSGAFEGAETGFGSLTGRLVAAEYELGLTLDAPVPGERMRAAVAGLLAEKEIIVEKRTKGGIKPHDMRPQILKADILAGEGREYTLKLTGTLTAAGGLRTEAFVKVLFGRLETDGSYHSRRVNMYFDGTLPLPVL